jgi:hypothetical protein
LKNIKILKKINIPIITAVLIVVLIILQAVNSFNNNVNKKTGQAGKQNLSVLAGSQDAATDNASFDNSSSDSDDTVKTIDISKVELGSDLEKAIQASDKDNKDKNIYRMKELIVFLGIPKEYQDKIKGYISKGYNVIDVFSVYEFLYQEYGTFKDMNTLLDMKRSGKSLEDVFAYFESKNKEFVPKNIDSKYLEKLLYVDKLKPDDIMLADRLSQKGIASFDTLIQGKTTGEQWKDICMENGIINISSQSPHYSVDNAKIKEAMDKYNLNQQTVLNAFVISYKFNVSRQEVIKEIKAGSSEVEIYAAAVKLKYNK